MKYDKHIVFLTPGFPSDENDDRCIPPLQALVKQIYAMNERIRISVIAFQYPFTDLPYRWHEIDVFPGNGQNKKFPRKLVTWQKCRAYFRQLHERIPVSFIHSFWLNECAYIGDKISRKFNLPHIVTLMGQDVLPTNHYLKLFRKPGFDAYALSRFQAEHYQRSSGREVKGILPFGIEVKDFPLFNEGEREWDVAGVGSLIEIKNYVEFIRIIKLLRADLPEIRVAIAGEGVQRSILEELIKLEGLSANITMKGGLSRKETLELLSKSKILLHTSKYESLGYVFPEALVSGCQVVSYQVGIAEKSDRWWIEKSPEKMAAAIKKALEKPAVRNDQLITPIAETAAAYLKIYHEKTA